MIDEEVGVPLIEPKVEETSIVVRKKRIRNHLPIMKQSGEMFSSANLMNLTGLTKEEMKLLTSRGIIRSVAKNRMGWALYDEEALRIIGEYKLNSRKKSESAMPFPVPSYTADEARTAFSMIEKGMKFEKIVEQIGIHPRAVRSIIQEYENLSGAIVIYKEFVDKINALPLDGSFPVTNGPEVYDIMAVAAEDCRCVSCRRRKRSEHCSSCERRMILQNLKVRAAAKEPLSGESKSETTPDE